ncbi:hypothetical protein POX_f07986 [Penicillium oxalicum]|uniref:hypothetical protein n=1 Tax=Penicillium oxalicum TaxID=69781 RepID=UPI0020B6CB73|nr:hypothetical protein POX_f07986 [Penicillium oxalicum]KAI2787613.1 hypothetical protein POX_f07986 [Penicillium oxalicum]
MPSLIPRWKKKKPPSFQALSPSDRDYFVDVLRATAPPQPETNLESQTRELRHDEQLDDDTLQSTSSSQTPAAPTSTHASIRKDLPRQHFRSIPPPAVQDQSLVLSKPSFNHFLVTTTEILKSWEQGDATDPTSISNHNRQTQCRTFSLELSSYMREYANKTRAVSSRGHIHRILEQCVLVRRKLREIEILMKGLKIDDSLDENARQLIGDTWRVMVSLGQDCWVDADYALKN